MLYQRCIEKGKVEYFEHKKLSKCMRSKRMTPKCLQNQGGIYERKGTSYGVHVCARIFAELTQDMRMVFQGMSPQNITAIQKQLTRYM